jgi:hypothetical protein
MRTPNWRTHTDLPDGDSILIAEYNNNRVQDVRIVADSDGTGVQCTLVRLMGGERTLLLPPYVECNSRFIAVSQDCNAVSLFGWERGNVVTTLGSTVLSCPRGLRLLRDDSVVVADRNNDRICSFSPRDVLLFTLSTPSLPADVMESGRDSYGVTTFVVAHDEGVSRVTANAPCDPLRISFLLSPTALACVSSTSRGRLIARDPGDDRAQGNLLL